MLIKYNSLPKLALFTTAFTLLTSSAIALPTGGQVTDGNATITNTANTTTINQTSKGANVNWATFGSNAGETINFNHPDSNSYTINRVTTPNVPSVLAGAMNANGRVVVVNNAGITFARGSQTNVGALVATTAKNFSINADGSYQASNFSKNPINFDGNVTVGRFPKSSDIPQDGYVYAIGKNINVGSTGEINANKGTVALIAGKTETVIDLRGDGKINYDYSAAGDGPQVSVNGLGYDYQAADTSNVNINGKITARQGDVLVLAKAKDVNSGVINLTGVIDASQDAIYNPESKPNYGSVYVSSSGNLNNSGLINVSSSGTEGGIAILKSKQNVNLGGDVKATSTAPAADKNNDGGQVDLIAYKDINSTANIDTSSSGDGYGGSVTASGKNVNISGPINVSSVDGVGGDIQAVATKNLTVTGAINASSVSNDAGNVVLAADNNVKINAPINATSDSGFGGYVQLTAGKDMEIKGTINASSVKGSGGDVDALAYGKLTNAAKIDVSAGANGFDGGTITMVAGRKFTSQHNASYNAADSNGETADGSIQLFGNQAANLNALNQMDIASTYGTVQR